MCPEKVSQIADKVEVALYDAVENSKKIKILLFIKIKFMLACH